jgi:MFS family permease
MASAVTAPAAESAGAADSAAGSFDRRLLPPMMLGAILNPVNSSIIAVALAPIATAFGAPASQAAWLISGLYLATSIGQPLVGRLVDLVGPKRMFLIGGALTGTAGVLGMLAPSIWVLVAARVILGFGTCAGYPAAMYLIRSESRRTGLKSPAGVLTALSVATQTIAVIGPTLGGLLIGLGGWRATLAVNLPLAAASIVLGWLFLPGGGAAASGAVSVDDPQRSAAVRQASAWARIDLPGVLLFAATLVAVLLFLMDARGGFAWLLGVAAAAGAGFVVRELRHADPFIDVRVLSGNVPLLLTYARSVVTATVAYAFLYGYTQWLEEGRGLSASVAGLVLLPTFGTGIVVASLTGRRAAVRGKLLASAAAQLAACGVLLTLGGGSAYWQLVLVAVLLGVPQGLANLANQNALYFQAQPERMGASAGLLRTFMYLGAMIASSANGAFFGVQATTPGLHVLAWFMLGCAVAFLVITLADGSLARIGREGAAAPERET